MPKTTPAPAPPAAITEEHFINRELSWLAFNQRVLEEAARADLPVLERVKFLAITASNLDEFFMVRVGGLQLLREQGKRVKDQSGMTPAQQLDLIRAQVTRFVERQYAILNEQILPELRLHGIRRLSATELTLNQRTFLHEHFTEHIFPVLSPVDVGRITSLPALQLALLCLVGSENEEDRQVVIVLPASLPRQVTVTEVEAGTYAYINLEDLIALFVHDYFPGKKSKASPASA